MTTCETIRRRLTAYLDGELPGEVGSVVRGHLRECAACRRVAADEAALRDSLRQLPPLDPPAALWAGVQARLAAAEVADAHTPRWRRHVARWARWLPSSATRFQLLAGGLAVAAAIVALTWRAQRQRIDDPAPLAQTGRDLSPRISQPDRGEQGAPAAPPTVGAPAADDVTAALVAEPAQTTASYDQVIVELMKLASEARSSWSDEQRAAFDGKIAELRGSISRAAAGRPAQRVQRQLIRYLQGALVRDEIMLASGGAR